MISFYHWATCFKDLDTPFGDFASDMLSDKTFPKRNIGKYSILKHLNSLQADRIAIEIFEMMYLSYSLDIGKINYYKISNIL